jgi:hypothetical protein
MHQEHKASIGEVAAANTSAGQGLPADSNVLSDPLVGLQRLKWMGRLAFKARYGVQLGVEADFGTWWGPRHDQRISHRRAALDCPTGLLYAYNVTWDEYAALTADVPAAVVEAVINHALACDMQMSAEVFAGLLADHLAAPTADVETTTGWAAGVRS